MELKSKSTENGSAGCDACTTASDTPIIMHRPYGSTVILSSANVGDTDAKVDVGEMQISWPWLATCSNESMSQTTKYFRYLLGRIRRGDPNYVCNAQIIHM